MKHQICANAKVFAEAVKDAAVYAAKDCGRGLDAVILTVIPKEKILSVVGCDGLGYYERKIQLEICKKQPKPSLPEKSMRLVISLSDVAMLAKFITPKGMGNIRLEVDDEQIVDGKYTVRLVLENGMTTTFFCKVNPELPDLGSIKSHALKGKKKPTLLNSLQLPVNELLRAGKVLSGKYSFASISTCKGIAQGVMALLECKDKGIDISLIFMLNEMDNA